MKRDTELFCLYQDYMKELWQYANTDAVKESLHLPEWWYDLTHSKDIRLHTLYNETKIIGFLFIEELKPEDRERLNAKWYINEAYILPEYRRRGLMSDLLDSALEKDADICLHIIRNNTAAKDFWKNYFHKRKYCDYLLPVMEGYENCDFYRFSKV